MPRDRRTRAERHAGWLEWAARAGYVARGIVFTAVGLTAAAVAAGLLRRPRGMLGVLRDIARQPLGAAVTGVLGLGLAAYATLSFVSAVREIDPESRHRQHLLMRAADAFSAMVYVGLAVLALRLMLQPQAEAARVAQGWAARVLALPGGRWLLGGAGGALVAAGLFLIGEAYVVRFAERFDRRTLGPRTMHALVAAARLGTGVRGAVMAVGGVLVIRAAVSRRPSRVGDIGDALAALASARFGPALLSIAAAGFLGYGAYQLAKAWFRRRPMV